MRLRRTPLRAAAGRLAGAALGLSCGAGAAQAQISVNPTVLDTGIPFELPATDRVTVLQRTHPELNALGIHAGGFLLLPQVKLDASGTDNVFGAASGKDADGSALVAPRIDAQSQWSRNALNAHAGAGLRRYFTYALKNENAYDVGVDGRVDLAGNSSVTARANADRIYINQASGDFPQFAAAPVPLSRLVGSVRGNYQGNRLQLVGDVNVTKLNFTDTRSLSGGTIDQDFLDQTATTLVGRAEYNWSPATSFFVQGNFALRRYRITTPTLDRNGSDIRLVGGAAFDITPLIRTRIGVGYLQRSYDNAQVKSLKGIALDLQVDYYLTELTTISFAARRDVRDAVLRNTPGYKSSRVAGEVDHELLRNLILVLRADYEFNNFAEIERKDKLFHTGLAAAYTLNRHIVISPTVDYTDRKSSGTSAGQRFNEWRGAIGLTLRI